MPSLAKCLEKFGGKLSEVEKQALQAASGAYQDQGTKVDAANMTAVEDILSGLEADKADIVGQIKAQLAEKTPSAAQYATKKQQVDETKFVKTATGSIDFGEITKETGKAIMRQAAPIRLEKGNKKYGQIHIEKKHGKQIRKAGYQSVDEFVLEVSSNIDEIWSAKGGRLLLVKKNDTSKVEFVELKPSEEGEFYSVQTAFIARKDYPQRQKIKLLWERSEPPAPASGEQAPFASTPQQAGETIPTAEGQSIKESITEPEEKSKPKKPKGSDDQYASRVLLSEVGLTSKDVQSIFEKWGQKTGLTPEGNVWVRTKTGHGLEIRAVDHIAEDRVSFEIGYGRMQKNGELIAGKYQDKTIELQRGVADKWTLVHEIEHWAEDIGLLEAADIRVLNREIRAEKKDDAYRPTKEDRAKWIESVLEDREKYRDRGRLYRILQKIGDFADALVNLAKRTSRGVARDFETGKIFEREGRLTVAEAVKEKGPLYKVVEPGPVTGKQALDDIEKDRSFANRIFEQRDVGIKESDREVGELQKEVQRLAGPKSRRRHSLGFAYDKKLKRSQESDRLDMAMMLFRDLKINPGKADEFRQWADGELASKETSKGRKIQIKKYLDILGRAEKLTAEQKALVDEIGGRFDRAFKIVNANKIVTSFVDHYVRRLWNLPKGKENDFRSTGAGYGFKTFTTAKMQRSFETILDGWMAGYDLKIKGLTNSYGAYTSDLEVILANKDFIYQGYNTRDIEGRRMFSTSRKGEHKDYAPLKAPGFKVWEWAGRAETEVAPDESKALMIDDHGRKFFFGAVERQPETWAVYKLDDEGNRGKKALRVFEDQKAADNFAKGKDFETEIEHRAAKDIADAWEERQLYAPKQLAEIINKMTARPRWMFESPGVQELARLNVAVKGWILLSSFFHHIAGAISWGFGVHHGWRAGKEIVDPLTGEKYKTASMNPVKAYKAGYKKIEDRAPIITLGIKNGLTLGDLRDWAETLLRDKKGVALRLANYLGLEKTGKAIEYAGFQREKFTDSLFKKFFAGLKAEAFVMEYIHELQKAQTAHLEKGAPPPDVNKIAEQVALLINADFGGMHLERMGRNPDLQTIAKLVLLAPDWCVDSKTRAMTKTGWKAYDELSLNDEIMAFDPKTKKLKWSKIKDKYVNEHYSGEMVKIKNHNRAVMMTPDHTCYVYNITTKRNDIVKANALQTNHTIPRSAGFDAPAQETYSDHYIKLVGWIVTDGYVKKSKNTLADGTVKEYRYGKITQSKPKTVKILKGMDLKYHVDNYNSDHDDFVSNYKKYVFTGPEDAFQKMEAEGVSEGLTWDFLSKLTHRQLKLLYDTMMLADGTGQNRFCGREQPVFFMTLIQTMLGWPSTFYRQEKNCWRTRRITPKNIYCWGHNNNTHKVDYSGTIWCPSVNTGFWLAEREGLVFITGNTESNFRTVTGMISWKGKGLNEWINKMIGDLPPPPGMDKIFRKFWARVALRITVSTIFAQMLLNGWDDSKEFYKEQLLSDQWSKFRWTGVDVSKIYKALGYDLEGKRKIFSIGRHFFDPLKLIEPDRLIKHKGSPATRVAGALLTGKDWRERPFTSAAEFAKTGKTIKASPYEEKEKFGNRLPAAAINQIINMQPVQVGYFLRYLQGEEDSLSALLQSAGMHMHTAWPPKLEGPIVPDKGDDSVYEAIQELIKSEALSMGPPSRRVTAAGMPRKLTPAQYREYLLESSNIVRRRLKDLIGSDRWERMGPKQRAKVVEKIVKSARKKTRQKLKKRYWKPVKKKQLNINEGKNREQQPELRGLPGA